MATARPLPRQEHGQEHAPDPLCCTVCGSEDPELLRRSTDVADDLAAAERGLDEPLHDEPTAVFACDRCRSLFRDTRGHGADVEERYRRDESSEEALDQLRERGLADLRHDRRWFHAHGVALGSRVLEIGSYAGAFLEFAAEEGADAIGIDVNADAAEFCRERGLDVRTGSFSAERLGTAFDSVWILNCFEQLPDPEVVLREVALVLRPGGTLVLRTPSAEFVRLAHESRLAPALRAIADANGLLGVPFERVFSAAALTRMLRRHGFDVSRIRGREFTSLVPTGRSSLWALHRPARFALYAAASAPTEPAPLPLARRRRSIGRLAIAGG